MTEKKKITDKSFDFDTVYDRRGWGSEKWDVQPGELPMWVADMDFRTAPAIIDALRRRTEHGIFGYTGISDEWYEAYINWWKTRHHFEMQKEWLIFTTGVVPALSSLVRRLTNPAEKVLVMTPIYNIFFNSIVNNGRVPLECPLRLVDGTFSLDFAQLEKDLADPQTTLLLFCNPQNPGGHIWSKEELTRIAELCADNGVRVVSDEIHCDIVREGKEYVPFASVSETAARISVSCMSPSKAFNTAGIHSAAVCVPDLHLRNRVSRGLNNDEVAEPNVFAISAAIAAYTEGGEWLDALNRYIDDNLKTAVKFIREEIPELVPIPGDATYLLWVDIRKLPHGGKNFAAFLRKRTGLYISAGRQYGEAGEGFVRINAACPRSVLQDGLNRLQEGVLMFQRMAESAGRE
ncbi:MAG: MalY/PatB family protein [Eubacterium sp.]|nr:MalY/PatB family protein [Eubacterium sp.]